MESVIFTGDIVCKKENEKRKSNKDPVFFIGDLHCSPNELSNEMYQALMNLNAPKKPSISNIHIAKSMKWYSSIRNKDLL